MPLKAKLQISRERLEFLYSLLIIILIPAGIIVNTIWFSTALQRDFDTELRRKANLANQITAVTVSQLLAHPDAKTRQASVQQLVNRIKTDTDEVTLLTVYLPDGPSFKVLASTDSRLVNSTVNNLQTGLAWQQTAPIAVLTADGSDRAWRVLNPVLDAKGQKVALISLDASLSAADQLTAGTLRTSIIILIVTIIITLLLLANHFRFVEYAVLFRKQKELDQMKNDFISVATHELKAPMTIIKGYLSNVLDGTSGKIDDQSRADIKVAFDQTDRLSHLVADLLDVSRLEQGRTKYDKAAVNLSDVITPIVTTYQPRAAQKGLKLTYDPLTPPATILADANRTAEIFTNLIDNAVKYSLKGTIHITHEADAHYIKTTVKDTGIGLSATERERLFQRFYRARNDKTESISGTGLGLWIIKQYIEAMGGHITVDSMEGVGSQFTVVLPRHQAR